MIKPHNLPANSYIDDPAEKLDPADPAESETNERNSKLGVALTWMIDWITRGRNNRKQRSIRLDTLILCVKPEFLPCKRPCAAWVALQHGVSPQRASLLQQEFAREIGPHIQFRGQHFLNQSSAPRMRRGRGRRGRQGPQPGPVAGA